MTPSVVLAPLILIGVLALSAVAKVRDEQSTRSVMINLRLPAALSGGLIPRVLPWAELAVAIALLLTAPGWQYTATALVVLALMLVYVVIVARAMTFDPRPTCGCFGRIGDHTIGPLTLVRNLLFVALSVLSLLIGIAGESVRTLLLDLSLAGWSWLGMAALSAAVAVLIRGRSQADGPSPYAAAPHGQPLPDAAQPAEPGELLDYERTSIPFGTLQDLDSGALVSMTDLIADSACLLILVNCTCPSTRDAFDQLDRWSAELGPLVTVRTVLATPTQSRSKWDSLARPGALIDHDGQVWMALGLDSQSPQAVLLGRDGLLAGGPVTGRADIDALVHDAAAELRHAIGAESDAAADRGPVR